jgi:hypothetical protein
MLLCSIVLTIIRFTTVLCTLAVLAIRTVIAPLQYEYCTTVCCHNISILDCN